MFTDANRNSSCSRDSLELDELRPSARRAGRNKILDVAWHYTRSCWYPAPTTQAVFLGAGVCGPRTHHLLMSRWTASATCRQTFEVANPILAERDRQQSKSN